MSLDIHPERSRVELDKSDRRKLRAMVGWVLVGLLALFIVLQLAGCASEPTVIAKFHGLCAFKVMGQDEHGNIVARTYCEARE